MSSVQSISRGSRTAGGVQEGILTLPQPFALYHGGVLGEARLAWRLVGDASLPLVAAMGGISAHRRVFDADEPRAGWWHEVVGPGRALDTTRCRILGIDFLGGSGESTRPLPNLPPPCIASMDQAVALAALLDHLRIAHVNTILGASYGGMVALAFGHRFPGRVKRLVVISAGDRTHPMATAWRSVQRATLRYAIEKGDAKGGLLLARALAMATYRSAEEFAARFSGEPVLREGRFVFPIEEYLFARGADYAEKYQAEAFLCLSQSIDLHRVDAAAIEVPTSVVAVREDHLVPIEDMRALAARLPNARLHELSSPHGHDAFLKEAGQLRPILACAYGDC